jgi:hypothetical protein
MEPSLQARLRRNNELALLIGNPWGLQRGDLKGRSQCVKQTRLATPSKPS